MRDLYIDDSAIDKVKEISKKYEEVWGKKVDYTIVPRGITQEKLVECIKLMIEDNLSLICAYEKLYKN